MPFVTVQLGQCGNQIGAEFFTSLMADAVKSYSSCSQRVNEDYRHEVCKRFFYEENGIYHPRAVLVDMEPKVITQTMAAGKHSGQWQYSTKQQFSRKSGSGNNWAHGFCVHGNRCQLEVSDIIRKQVENCDRFDGFLCLMSLAGGTGSGFGTYVTKILRDEYPQAFILNQVVAPYCSGEVIVQSYNALLTLANLYQSSDGLILIENDQMHEICARLLNVKQVAFSHINKVVSHKMAGLLSPASSQSGYYTHSNELGELIGHLFSHPSYKLSTLLNVPLMADNCIEFSTFQWQSITKTLRQMLIAKAHMEEGINWGVKIRPQSSYNKSLSNVLVLRGKDSHTVDCSPFSEAAMYPSWLPPQDLLHVYSSKRPFAMYEKSAYLISNSQFCVDTVDVLVDKAWTMYTSRAYIHQYLKHGLTDDDFLDCFTIMERVLHNYRHL